MMIAAIILAGYAFYRAQVGCCVSILQAWHKRPNEIKITLQRKAEDTAKPAHLFDRNRVIDIRFQPRVKDLGHQRVRLQETRNLERTLILLADA